MEIINRESTLKELQAEAKARNIRVTKYTSADALFEMIEDYDEQAELPMYRVTKHVAKRPGLSEVAEFKVGELVLQFMASTAGEETHVKNVEGKSGQIPEESLQKIMLPWNLFIEPRLIGIF